MLDEAQKDRLVHLFADGVELPAAARAAFVARQCADDPVLRLELAELLESFLEHRPVAAGPPSGLYQLRKFARRHRAQVVAAALVLLSLVLGLSGSLWFLIEAKVNEAAAVERAREAEGVRIAAEAALVAKDRPNTAYGPIPS